MISAKIQADCFIQQPAVHVAILAHQAAHHRAAVCVVHILAADWADKLSHWLLLQQTITSTPDNACISRLKSSARLLWSLKCNRYTCRNCTAEQMWNVTTEAGMKTLVWHWPGSSWPPSTEQRAAEPACRKRPLARSYGLIIWLMMKKHSFCWRLPDDSGLFC